MFNILAPWDGLFDTAKDAAGEIITNALHSICFAIDHIVYSLIPRLYRLIVSLANVDLYTNNEAISTLMNRVYILVGIFMLFKLAFSIIRYIVDPNSFSDQTKGFTNLVKRVLIALVLLVTTPWLFGKMYELQGIILNSIILPNLILGTCDDGVSSLDSAAIDVQFLVFSPFFTVNPVGELSDCASSDNYPLANILGSTDMALASDGEGSCLDAFAKAMDADESVQASNVTIEQFFKDDSSTDADTRSFGSLGSLLYMKINGGADYAISYLPIVSTICGGYLVFLLLSFCIDIAVRAIKLMFLQILSPIAFITSVDPTSSSGNDKLKDWGKECLTTFLSLFLRLAVVYMVIQMVKVVTSKMFRGSLYYEGFKDNANSAMNIFVYIFLVLGAFQVAKKIPDLLEKALGIKMSGELSMNPFKNSFVAGAAGAAAGFGLAGVGSGLANMWAFGANTTNRLKQFKEDGGVQALAGSAKTYGDAWKFNLETIKDVKNVDGFRNKIGHLRAGFQLSKEQRRSTAIGKALHGVAQTMSSAGGIVTGAASGAARGTVSSYGKKGKDIMHSAGSAVNRVTDIRNDRDKRVEGRFEGKDSVFSRRQVLKDTIDKAAGVKNKDHGVGLAGEQIKSKQLELKSLESQLTQANYLLQEARARGADSLTVSNLEQQVKDLEKDYRQKDKEIKELQDAANQIPGFGKDKK